MHDCCGCEQRSRRSESLRSLAAMIVNASADAVSIRLNAIGSSAPPAGSWMQRVHAPSAAQDLCSPTAASARIVDQQILHR